MDHKDLLLVPKHDFYFEIYFLTHFYINVSKQKLKHEKKHI